MKLRATLALLSSLLSRSAKLAKIADVGFLNPQAGANAQATPMRGAASVRDMGGHRGNPFPQPR